MKVKVRLFAVFRETLKADWIDVELDTGATVSRVFDEIFPEGSEGSRYKNLCAFALNKRYVEREATVAEGDEVAFIPPVAGG